MSDDKIDEMIKISSEKLVLLNKIMELTKEQNLIIDKSNMERLDSIIDEKDLLMKRVDELDAKFITYFAELKRENEVESLDDIDSSIYPNLAKLKELVKEITSTIMAISVLDDKNNAILKKELEKIKHNLRTLKKGQKAYNGYNKKVDHNIMIDEKK